MSSRLPLSFQSAPARTFRSTSPARTLLAAATLLGGLFASGSVSLGQSVATVPVGAMTVSIAAGTVNAPATTDFSIPLVDTAANVGISTGSISAVTTNSITITNAGWVSGALATTQFPYAFQILTGSGEGNIYNISANTTDTISITGTDLIAAGVQSGNLIKLIPVDTLNTLFGSNTVLGSSSPTSADIVTLGTTSSISFYYNTSLGRWVRTSGPTTDRGSTPIPPNTAISITRKSVAFTLTFAGTVPQTRHRTLVGNAGSTYTNTGFPTDVTLGQLAVQSSLPGWVSSSSASTADILLVLSGGVQLAYFHNGSNWLRTTGPATNRDSISIPAGTPIMVFKRGANPGFTYLTKALPYTL